MISRRCSFCDATLEAADLDGYGTAGLAHVRAEHPDLTYPDLAVRNYFESEARMTGGTERLDAIGPVEVHAVTDDRIDDWAAFFDADALVDTPQNASCYCLEPHEVVPGQPLRAFGHWTERRAAMIELLRAGTAFGYLAYVDGRPRAWVNASMRAGYTLFRRGDGDDGTIVAIACFAVAPPYRGHGLAPALLAQVVADAPSRGATAVEAYPLLEPGAGGGFRGDRRMYEAAGFQAVQVRQRDTVMRRLL